MMVPVQGLFEAHLTVRDLDRALRFYTELLGLTQASRFDDRRCAFVWADSNRSSMLGLWEIGSAPQQMSLHIAFRTSPEDVLRSVPRLRANGIEPLSFDGAPTDEPAVLCWMPAVSIYFRDPDNHLLEFLAMLPHAPRPELGILSWNAWTAVASSAPEREHSAATIGGRP